MKARVLIADDSVHMRMILKDILVKCGYEVVGEADDGAEAVKLYNELLPDVATIDISMPKIRKVLEDNRFDCVIASLHLLL